MSQHTTSHENAFLGKRRDRAGPDPRPRLFRAGSSPRGDCPRPSLRESVGRLPSGLMVRERKQLDFDRLPLSPLPAVDFSHAHEQISYLWPLRSKPAVPLLGADSHIELQPCKPDASSETTARDESASRIKHEPAAPLQRRQPFTSTALSQVRYLLKALDFLYYFFKDSPSSQLEELSKESGLSPTILRAWLEQRDCILDTALKLKDSLEPDY